MTPDVDIIFHKFKTRIARLGTTKAWLGRLSSQPPPADSLADCVRNRVFNGLSRLVRLEIARAVAEHQAV